MAKKEFIFKGNSMEDLKAMPLEQFIELIPSNERRKVKRGFTEAEKIFLKEIKAKDSVKTHCRDMIILPLMVDKIVKVHNGKTFVEVRILPQMIGHRLGEFALSRSRVKHGSVGVASAIKH